MTRSATLSALRVYRETWAKGQLPYAHFDAAEEMQSVNVIEDFVQREENACERSCPEGHLTSSALVTNYELDHVLLTLHKKLGKWLQLGGHTDGSWDIATSSLREVQEEAGVGPEATSLFNWQKVFEIPDSSSALPFDCDVHEIPGRANEPKHKHFDLRYLVLVDARLPLAISEESEDLGWFSLSRARELTQERSMLRQFDKLEALRRALLARGALPNFRNT